MSIALLDPDSMPAFLDMCPTHISGEALMPRDHQLPLSLAFPGQKTFMGRPIDPGTVVTCTADFSAFALRRYAKTNGIKDLEQQAATRESIRREEEAA